MILLLTFKSRYGKGQKANASVPFRVYELGLTNFAISMSQIAVVIQSLNSPEWFLEVTQNLLFKYQTVVSLEHLSVGQIMI